MPRTVSSRKASDCGHGRRELEVGLITFFLTCTCVSHCIIYSFILHCYIIRINILTPPRQTYAISPLHLCAI